MFRRAVHLELVDCLSAEVFVLAQRRFVARRGIPMPIRFDNATSLRTVADQLSVNESSTLHQCRGMKDFMNTLASGDG